METTMMSKAATTKVATETRVSPREIERQISEIDALQLKLKEAKEAVKAAKQAEKEAKEAAKLAAKQAKSKTRYSVFAEILKSTKETPLTAEEMFAKMHTLYGGSEIESEYKVRHGLSYVTELGLTEVVDGKIKFIG